MKILSHLCHSERSEESRGFNGILRLRLRMTAAIIILMFICGVANASAPARIVSLKPNITDIIYDIGLGEKLVGITKYCEVPDKTKKPQVVADYTQPYIEKIIALAPDVVIGSEENSSRRSIEDIRRIGIKVDIFPFTTIQETISSIRKMGEVLGVKEKANVVAAKMEERLKDIAKKWNVHPPQKVVIVWGIRPLVVAGQGSYIDEMLQNVGAVNAVKKTAIKYPRLGLEELIAINPDVIIDLSMGSETNLDARPWKNIETITAVREKKVFSLNAGDFRASPKIADSLEKLAELIH